LVSENLHRLETTHRPAARAVDRFTLVRHQEPAGTDGNDRAALLICSLLLIIVAVDPITGPIKAEPTALALAEFGSEAGGASTK
jgi:hypothetical protein